MKVKTNNRFYDIKEDRLREIGDVFEVTQSRYKDVQRFVEEVKETKKTSKKK